MPTASDEPHYLIIMQSLTQDHDLDLTNNYASEAYREFIPDELRERHVIQVGRGNTRSVTSDCLSWCAALRGWWPRTRTRVATTMRRQRRSAVRDDRCRHQRR